MNLSQLHAQNICKEFKQGKNILSVLKNINITFQQKETYAITGVSGSGKSTFLHLLGGLDIPTSGNILFNEQDIFKLPNFQKEQFLNTSIGFVFQFHYLINELTILENIMLMGLIKKQTKKETIKHAHMLLKHVELSHKANNYPFELSGGEQQRISIIRAIFNKPQFLLADEPTGNLDAQNAQHIIKLLLKCQKEWNMGIIICSHDQAISKAMQNILVLQNKTITTQKS